MKDNRSKLALYGSAGKRLYMWNFRVMDLQLMLVTEFPKSGGSWFCQMLSEASHVPFPRNRAPKFEKCIMHGHHLFNRRMQKAIAILRDGRDVMVSAYFHFLFEHDRNSARSVAYHRRKLQFANYDDVRANLPKFIHYMFNDYPKRNCLHFSWAEFVTNIYRYSDYLLIIKYEDLLNNAGECLQRALEFYSLNKYSTADLQRIVEDYSFKKVAKRNPGQEDRESFIRKGISGDWKNYFNSEACEVFKKYAGDSLIEAGYEENLFWTN